MILINRLSDNLIINYRQKADWRWYDKLSQLQADYDALPGNTSQQVRDIMLFNISELESDRDAWYTRFKTNAGVNPDTHGIVHVPPGQETQALTARDITYDGENLTFDANPVYSIVGSVVTVHPGWVVKDYRLVAEDVTDFSSLVLTESLYFKLVFAQSLATEDISVMLLTRLENEGFGAFPASQKELWTIVEGRVNLDLSITEGVF